MEILEMLSSYNIWTILMIGVAFIVGIIKLIEGAKKLWQKRQDFQQQNIAKGIEKEQKKEAQEHRLECEQREIQDMQSQLNLLLQIIEKQQEQIDLLIQSDELDIKAWIKNQHEKWMALQCIDSQSLELLCHRYEIYAKEGGNSWAERLVDDLKSLPVVTTAPLTHNN